MLPPPSILGGRKVTDLPSSTRLELLIKELRGKASSPTLKGAMFMLMITYMKMTDVPANENLVLYCVKVGVIRTLPTNFSCHDI